ncbi:DNA/RNA polymerase [Tricholoma matsutake]|nr:DNA/RNA polymerase [Tricholoma matsutake 945]
MRLHELEAFILLDSGCTSDSISPEFTMSANLKAHKLEELVPLQLGTVGSCSKINFGLFTDFGIGEIKNTHYFDVVNINRYDAILGTVFMRKHGIVLDFESDKVCVNDLNDILFAICKDRADKARSKGPLSKKDLPRLQEEWKQSCQDILNGVPDKLPPLREINHHIPLVEEKRKYNYYFPKCPNSMRKPLAEIIAKYCKAGWWRPAHTEQATPMLVVPKKTGKLRTVINAVKHNTNMVKDVTPFPDQDLIRLDVAQAKYHSKIDLSDVYEQV